MIGDCPGCAQEGADVREPRRARARLPWLAFLPAILYALAPKCPLCLVAYLSAFGVTFGMASLALSVLRSLAVALVVLALGFAIRRAKVPSFRDRAQRYSAERGSSSSANGSASLVKRYPPFSRERRRAFGDALREMRRTIAENPPWIPKIDPTTDPDWRNKFTQVAR